MIRQLRDRLAAERLATIEVRETSGEVCDAACRARAARERARIRALSQGVLR